MKRTLFACLITLLLMVSGCEKAENFDSQNGLAETEVDSSDNSKNNVPSASENVPNEEIKKPDVPENQPENPSEHQANEPTNSTNDNSITANLQNPTAGLTAEDVAQDIVHILSNYDLQMLSMYVHPSHGVRFSPLVMSICRPILFSQQDNYLV